LHESFGLESNLVKFEEILESNLEKFEEILESNLEKFEEILERQADFAPPFQIAELAISFNSR
jgi:hypothetical protein